MKTIHDKETLIAQLTDDALSSDKARVVFFAGHAPLLYHSGSDCRLPRAYLEVGLFGAFTEHSLELACEVANNVKSEKDVSFMIVVDDWNYKNDQLALMDKEKSKARTDFYKNSNGSNGILHENLLSILNKWSFNESNVLRHNHNKNGRDNNLYHSEAILKRDSGRTNLNDCANAYMGLVNETKFGKESDYLISFIPSRCTGNVCTGVLDIAETVIESSHVFTKTDSDLLMYADTVAKIWGVEPIAKLPLSLQTKGVLYRKD